MCECALHEVLAGALGDVVADDGKARLGELHGERKPDIAKADHSDDRRAVLNSGKQRVFHAHDVS